MQPKSQSLALCLLAASALAAAEPASTGALTVQWRYDAGKALHATPAAAGKRLYLADASGRVLALDLATRQKQWEATGDGDVSAGLLLEDSRLFVASEQGLIRALSASDGKELWRFSAKDKIVSRPAAADGILYAGSYDEHLYALDSASGRLLWKFKTNAQLHASPTVAGAMVLIAGCDGQIRAVDAKSGIQKWALDLGEPMAASPRVKDGIAFAGTLKGERFAVEVSTGRLLWRNDGNQTRGDSIMATASPGEDTVAFITQTGIQVMHRISDGKWLSSSFYKGRISSDGVTWQGATWYVAEEGKVIGPVRKGGQSSFTAGGEIKAAPLALGDELILVDESGMVWGLSLK